MIPVLGFATISKFDLADRLLRSIDYPVEHLVIVNNSGTKQWQPDKHYQINTARPLLGNTKR